MDKAGKLKKSLPVIKVKKQGKNRDKAGKFLEGTSGNPNGRPPKGYSLTDMVKEMLSSNPRRKKELIKTIFNLAIHKGDPTMIKLIWNYMDGQPTQSIDLNTPPDDSEKERLKELVNRVENAIKQRRLPSHKGTAKSI
jgi:hypothetical protein